MSGKKQHFIPQSLLRGFGIKKGKKTFVSVFPYHGENFDTATDGIGAKRYFYSTVVKDNPEPTLDDKITGYETDLGLFIRYIRSLQFEEKVDASKAAELVTHLIVRNAHFRDSTADGVDRMYDEIFGIFQDRDRTRAALGLDGNEPSRVLLDAIKSGVEDYAETFRLLGMSNEDATALMFAQAKPLFEQNFAKLASSFSEMREKLNGDIGTIGADAQRRVLGQELAPKARVEQLSQFEWSIERGPPEGLILSDCVAVGITRAGVFPAALIDIDDSMLMLLPISSDHLLLGTRGDNSLLPIDINSKMASCGWDFFIAPNQCEKLDHLKPLLRTTTARLFDNAIDEVVSEY